MAKKVIASFVIAATLLGYSTANAQIVTLSRADIELINLIAERERSAGYVDGLLSLALVQPLLTTNPIEFTVNLIRMDINAMRGGVANWNKIVACDILGLIQVHELDYPENFEFWHPLQEIYEARCSR